MVQSALMHLVRQGTRLNGVLYYHTSRPLLAGQDWRRRNGLPSNPNSYGSLTDLPDYSFLDGRRTPVGQGRVRRAREQHEVATKIIQLTKEVDFAVQHDIDRKREREDRNQQILDRKLKSKGDQQQLTPKRSR